MDKIQVLEKLLATMLMYESEFNQYINLYKNNNNGGATGNNGGATGNNGGGGTTGVVSCDTSKLNSMLNNLDKQGRKINRIYKEIFPKQTNPT